ncbi:MAG: BMP family ABC transporter substrate-binding protein [Actinomycetota bacterium]
MKRSALLVVLAMALSLVSVSAQAAPMVIVGIAYDTGGPGDHSFNDAVAKGIASAKKSVKVEIVETVTIGTDENRQLRLEYLITRGATYILAVGSGYAPAVQRVAAAHPKLQFGIINDSSIGGLNVSSLIFNEKQGGYLAGTLAGLATKTKKIGLIGSAEQNKDFEYGYLAGTRATKRDVFVDVQYPKDSLGAAAKLMISKAVDVIFVTTAGSDTDILTAVADANKNGLKVSLIGVEPDQYASLVASAKKFVLASVVKRVDRTVVEFITHAKLDYPVTDILDSGKGIYGRRYGVAGGGLEFSLWTKASQKFQKQLTAASKRIAKNSWYLK